MPVWFYQVQLLIYQLQKAITNFIEKNLGIGMKEHKPRMTMPISMFLISIEKKARHWSSKRLYEPLTQKCLPLSRMIKGNSLSAKPMASDRPHGS